MELFLLLSQILLGSFLDLRGHFPGISGARKGLKIGIRELEKSSGLQPLSSGKASVMFQKRVL